MTPMIPMHFKCSVQVGNVPVPVQVTAVLHQGEVHGIAFAADGLTLRSLAGGQSCLPWGLTLARRVKVYWCHLMSLAGRATWEALFGRMDSDNFKSPSQLPLNIVEPTWPGCREIMTWRMWLNKIMFWPGTNEVSFLGGVFIAHGAVLVTGFSSADTWWPHPQGGQKWALKGMTIEWPLLTYSLK